MKLTKAGGECVSPDVSDPFVVVKSRIIILELLEQYVDIVFLNEDEAFSLTGADAVESLELMTTCWNRDHRGQARIEGFFNSAQ